MKADPAWQNGNYTQPPPAMIAELIWDMNVTTPANYARSHPLDHFDADFDKYRKGILPFDANDWITQLEAVLRLDVSHGGAMEDAAKRVKARVLVVSSQQDHMVNPKPALDFAALLGARTVVLNGDCGHIAFSCEGGTLNPIVRAFLDSK